MRPKLLAVALIGLLVGADEGKDDKAKLQGMWQAISSNQGGRDDPQADLHTMTFDQDTVVIKRAERTFVKGRFKLEAAKSPKHIDIVIEEGPDNHKGKTARGIFEVKDDTLKWATSPPGATERPPGFGSTEGTMNMVVNFKRAKK